MRLRKHFNHHYVLAQKEKRKIINQGIFFVLFGSILMFIATMIMLHEPLHGTFWNFIMYLLQPAVWFLFWEGLGLIVFDSKTTKPELEFYSKMSKADIKFESY